MCIMFAVGIQTIIINRSMGACICGLSLLLDQQKAFHFPENSVM